MSERMLNTVLPIISRFSLAISLVFCVSILHAADLLPCPDCGNEVSPRAVLCPKCGCPAEAIRESIQIVEKLSELTPFLRVTSDVGESFAVAFADGQTNYIVMPYQGLAGATTLTITSLNGGSSVAYSRLAVANRDPLVRFDSIATNINYLCVASKDQKADVANTLYPSAKHGTLEVQKVGEPLSKDCVVTLTADANTNVLAVVFDAGRYDLREIEWVRCNPRDFRRQSSAILNAAKVDPEDKAAAQAGLEGLESIDQWITVYMKDEAESAAKKLRALTQAGNEYK